MVRCTSFCVPVVLSSSSWAEAARGTQVVPCRGTVGFGDVVQDLKYLQSRLSYVTGATAHCGFAQRAESVRIDFICKLLRQGEEVIFTGHFLGGAVASLLCLRVLESGKGAFGERVNCITFGCPLFASCGLADWVNANYRDLFTHIVSRRDVGPKILPFVSTLQKLGYAVEDHLEGLLVLRKLLELLPGVPLVPLISGVERKIPSLFKFLLRNIMKLALPTGMTGSYAFAGDVVILDTEATGSAPGLVLASADEMNVWHSQLGFAFGRGFNVTMMKEHMLDRYQNGILRALFSHAQLKQQELPCSGVARTFSQAVAPQGFGLRILHDKFNHSPYEGWANTEAESLSPENGKHQSSVIFRTTPPESTKGDPCEVWVRCETPSSKRGSFMSVRHGSNLGDTQKKSAHCHLTSKAQASSFLLTKGEGEAREARLLTRTKSDGLSSLVLIKNLLLGSGAVQVEIYARQQLPQQEFGLGTQISTK